MWIDCWHFMLNFVMLCCTAQGGWIPFCLFACDSRIAQCGLIGFVVAGPPHACLRRLICDSVLHDVRLRRSKSARLGPSGRGATLACPHRSHETPAFEQDEGPLSCPLTVARSPFGWASCPVSTASCPVSTASCPVSTAMSFCQGCLCPSDPLLRN